MRRFQRNRSAIILRFIACLAGFVGICTACVPQRLGNIATPASQAPLPATLAPAGTALPSQAPAISLNTPESWPTHEAAAGASPTTPIVTPTSAAPAGSNIHPVYAIQGEFDYSSHLLTAHEAISFTNTTRIDLTRLVFGVDQPGEKPGFTIHAISVVGQAEPTVQLDGGRMEVVLEQPVKAGNGVAMTIDYDLKLTAGGGATGYSDRQANLGDWYPYLAYYDLQQGWLLHPAGNAGESQVYPLADFYVQIAIQQPELVIAASHPIEMDNGEMIFHARHVRNVSWSASPAYQVLQSEEGGVVLKQYVFPEHAEAGRAALETAKQAYTLYTDLFGEIYLAQLSMVEVDAFDGMEYDGLFFLSQDYFAAYTSSPMSYLTMLTAHEVAHQWWYASVGNDQALEPWLDEALCTFSEELFYEQNYPYLVDWWWTFRVTRFSPEGWVNSSIYDHPGFRPYVNAVYLRGAQYLQALDRAMGRDKMRQFLRDYHNAMAGKIATAADFDILLGKSIGSDQLKEIKADYFH